MKTLIIVALLISLCGCAAVNVAEKPQALAGCAAADALTTAYAVHTGVAHEVNPLLRLSVNTGHYLPMILSKVAIVGVVWWIYDKYQDSQAAKAGIGVATAVTCGAAINTAAIIMK